MLDLCYRPLLPASCNEDTPGADVGLLVSFWYEAISALAVEQGGQIGAETLLCETEEQDMCDSEWAE